MIIDGKKIADEVLHMLEQDRTSLPEELMLGVILCEGDAATESFVRIKERVANRLGVKLARVAILADATTGDVVEAVERLTRVTKGVIVQLPLPRSIDTEAVLQSIPQSHDVDAINPTTTLLRAPVAEAISEILQRTNTSVLAKQAVVVGTGRLVGTPAAKLLGELGAKVQMVTKEQGSMDSLHFADIAVLGAGTPGLVKPQMLKPGVVLIDAGTSEQGGRVVGDADPQCAEVASVFTPVPGGVGPIAVAMIFKNLFTLARMQK